MTKVQLHYALDRPLDEILMKRIAQAHGVYGITRIQPAPSLDNLLVEYDASRLTPPQVMALLHQRGIPVRAAQNRG